MRITVDTSARNRTLSSGSDLTGSALPQKWDVGLGYSQYRPAVADGYVVDMLDC